MRAAVLYGPEDIRMEEVPISVPGPGEVLVRVDVASVDFTDRKVFLRGSHPMIKTPGLFGHEWAGTIVEVGPDTGGALASRTAGGRRELLPLS
jgi:L-iditol 2-dehydrogenase